jgi:quercetin dioxygenase-like cupin family protein
MLRSRIFVAAIAFAMPVAAQAQESPQRKELRRVDLSGAAGMEVISSISEFKPGDELPRHFHHGVEAGYVVQGAMVQNPGQPPAMLATGAPILNLRDVVHGGFKVVGPGNLILFTVHTVDKGKPLYDWAKELNSTSQRALGGERSSHARPDHWNDRSDATQQRYQLACH